ncbi:hypothetical protein PH505_cr00040 [Pseudoalteromonas distincta]|nr:hypothetical protein PH505_cr00040 [Pseudoalteromonas distincta]
MFVADITNHFYASYDYTQPPAWDSALFYQQSSEAKYLKDL